MPLRVSKSQTEPAQSSRTCSQILVAVGCACPGLVGIGGKVVSRPCRECKGRDLLAACVLHICVRAPHACSEGIATRAAEQCALAWRRGRSVDGSLTHVRWPGTREQDVHVSRAALESLLEPPGIVLHLAGQQVSAGQLSDSRRHLPHCRRRPGRRRSGPQAS